VNWANRQKPIRIVLEKTIGIHRDRVLPLFAKETFESWFEKRSRKRAIEGTSERTSTRKKVIIFETCSVNYNYPSVGRAAVQVLEHNGVEVVRPPQVCCGMPALDGGDVEKAVAHAERNVKTLLPLVKEGTPIVVCSPTCGYVMKQDWPDLLGTEDAKLVAAATFDVGEYLAGMKKDGELDTNFTETQGKLAYHVPCHLRAQNIGQPFTPIMKGIPNTSVEPIEQCSAFDGTWGMKKEYYKMSRQCAGKLCRQMEESDADRFVSDCMMAGLNVVEELGKAPVHPVEVLRDAYGLEDE
jgi:Fe-S oxidoreductase